jgi:hypothetical protein
VPIEQFGRTNAQGVVPRGSGWQRFGQGAFVRLTGYEAMGQRIANMSAACQAARDLRIVFGSDVFYAPFQNWGTRFITGTFFLQAGQEAAKRSLQRSLPPAIAEGPVAVLRAFHDAGEAGVKAAQPLVRVRTGKLVRSVHMFGTRG